MTVTCKTSKRTMILPRYNRLRKSPNDPLPQQHQEPEPPEDINGEPEWEVDMVLASRVTGKAKKLQYQVSWKGCDPDDQWYLAENFKNAATALEAFHLKYPEASGPPVNLRDWIRAAAEDRHPEDRDNDNVAEHVGVTKKEANAAQIKPRAPRTRYSGLRGGSMTAQGNSPHAAGIHVSTRRGIARATRHRTTFSPRIAPPANLTMVRRLFRPKA
ncbi:hypothetical protein RB594_003658 [Gaeumannomyces avenae]